MPDQPQTSPPQTPEPEIHVMPEEFIGVGRGGVRAAKAAEAAEIAKAPKSAAPTARRAPIILIVSGVLVLIGLVVGAFFLLRTPTPTRTIQVPSPESRVPTPAPRPTSTPPQLRAPTSTPATVTPPSPVTAPKLPLRNAFDSDVDGLTDEEERLYGSNPTRPDSDNDGFLDGNEVFNLYSPAATAPATLQQTGLVQSYADNLGRYDVLYPTSFEVRTVDISKGIQQFFFGGETIQIQVEENPNGDDVMAWYLARSPGVSRSELESLTTKAGYAGIRSPDRLTVYIGFGTYVFVVSYDPGTAPELQYRRTYEMMINSLRGIRASS